MTQKLPRRAQTNGPEGKHLYGLARRREDANAGPRAAGNREGPCYAVLDDDIQLLACSAAFEATYGEPDGRLNSEVQESVREMAAQIRVAGGSASLERGDATVLRLTRMQGFIPVYVLCVEGVRRGSNLPEISRRFALSARESQVLGLVLQGKTHIEIAAELCISSATVASHVRNIGIKLGCSKRSSIVARALGII